MTDAVRPPSRYRVFHRLVLISVLIYFLLVGFMCILENQLVYRAEAHTKFWEPAPTSEVENITLTSGDGNTIHGWYLEAANSKTVLLFCHGNAKNLSAYGKSLFRIREKLGCSVFIFDYPGYGQSTGSPSELSCYNSAESAWEWLTKTKNFSERNIIIYGESLGGGVATELASHHPCRLLLLVKTFTSLPGVGMKRYPWIPVYLVMRNRFDNISKIGKVQSPIFITGATKDGTVPYEHSQELFETATAPKTFFPLEDQDHMDRLTDEYYEKLKEFLRETEGK